MFDNVQVLAKEVCDSACGSASCADGAAVGGEAADACLLVYGGEVGHHQSAVEAVVVNVVFFGVGYYRHGDRKALIATA